MRWVTYFLFTFLTKRRLFWKKKIAESLRERERTKRDVGENLVRKQSASQNSLKCGLPTPHSLRSALGGVFHGEY